MASPMTVAVARAQLLDHLDDDGTRWPVVSQTNALTWGLSTCLREYAGAGKSRLNIEGSFQSDLSGLVDLSSFNVTAIRGVTMLVGTRNFPIYEIQPEQRNLLDNVIRTYTVRYVRNYSLSVTDSDPLVGVGAVAGPTWDAFDHWVVAKAAIFASAKDGSVRQELVQLEGMMKDAVMLDPDIPHSSRFPGQPVWYSGWYTWYWRPDIQKMQICKRI